MVTQLKVKVNTDLKINTTQNWIKTNYKGYYDKKKNSHNTSY